MSGHDGSDQADSGPESGQSESGQSGTDDASAPAPARLPELDALARLPELDALPVHEHPAVYEDAHRRLRDALADPEPGPGLR